MSPVPESWQRTLDMRDSLIVQAHQRGVSVADLARQWSLSVGHVGKIVWRGGR